MTTEAEPRVLITIKDLSDDIPILSFIRRLPKNAKKKLLKKPSSAFFIFRMLPSQAQAIVLKMLWHPQLALVKKHTNVEIIEKQLPLLIGCGLIVKIGDELSLNPSFRKAYLKASSEGAFGCSKLSYVNEENEKKAKKDIAKHSIERWEEVLKYLALPSEENANNVYIVTKELFQAAGFTSGIEGSPEITTSGFQFLLLNQVQQLWIYLIAYFKHELAEKANVLELLDLLIRIILSVECKTDIESGGRPLHIDEGWSQHQFNFFMHLRMLGLIYIRKRRDGCFYPTPLLSNLCVSSEDVEATLQKKEGTIVVESNFRIYCYTDSDLQLAILSTFTEILYRFPNLCIGVLTRESVRKALFVGISATQIVQFLRMNSHPQVVAKLGYMDAVPITISEQIRLWEKERKRLTFNDAVLYTGFDSMKEFETLKQFVEEANCLLFSNSAGNQMTIVISETGHEKVREWWRTRHN